MLGPKPLGFWSSNSLDPYEFMQVGAQYQVRERFVDFDNAEHSAGETWTFLGAGVLPYEGGVTWVISLDGKTEWKVRMSWNEPSQANVLDHLSEYLRPVL